MNAAVYKCLTCLICLIPFLFSAQGQRYKAGEPLPDLALSPVYINDRSGEDTFRIASLKGKKILLTFNRYVSCPLCNFRTHELLEVYDTLQHHGLVILSVYESTKETLKAYTSKEEIPFVMIADPEEKLYKSFKIQKSWIRSFAGLFKDYPRKHKGGKKLFKGSYKREGHLNRIGADFLIDEKGIIQVAYYGKFAGDHLSVDEIVKWVQAN
jgi:peroxiredoxin Q/BCP